MWNSLPWETMEEAPVLKLLKTGLDQFLENREEKVTGMGQGIE